MPAKPKDQLALDEKVVQDAELEAALEELQTAGAAFSDARITRDRVKREADGRIEALDLGIDSAVRVGRFRITKTMRPASHREGFDISAKEKINIEVASDGTV